MDKKIDFNEFIASVAVENQDFVRELHERLIDLARYRDQMAKSIIWFRYIQEDHCKLCISEEKDVVRIYGVHVNQYEEVLETAG